MTEIKQQALVDINEAKNEKELQDVKVKYLGKKGSVTDPVETGTKAFRGTTQIYA